MALIWERKEKKITHYLLESPLAFFLIVVNIVLIFWIFHILFAIFTDSLDHMSLYGWVEHLYALLK